MRRARTALAIPLLLALLLVAVGVPAQPPPRAADASRVTLAFDSADIATVIRTVSEILGFNYVLAPEVTGKVTVETAAPVARDELFGILLAILEVHGFTVVTSGDIHKVVRFEEGRRRPARIVVGGATEAEPTGDDMVTQIVPLRFAPVGAVVTLLQPMISRTGGVVGHPASNLVIITDLAPNVRRALAAVRAVDVAGAGEQVKVVPLRFADAAELAALLSERARRLTAPGGPVPRVVADRRGNALVIQATAGELAAMERLIGELDVDAAGGRRIFIRVAEHVKAKDLAASLQAIYAEADEATGRPEERRRIVVDETTNAVLVQALPQAWVEMSAVIDQLDRPLRQVLVETLVMEIALTESSRFGIDWAARVGRARVVSATTGVVPAGETLALVQAGAAPGLTAFGLINEDFAALLTALATDNRAKVVSRTSLLVTENHKAVVNVSMSIPIVTSQPLSAGDLAAAAAAVAAGGAVPAYNPNQLVEYRDVGVILTVEPRLGDAGTVQLTIKQAVNDLGDPEPPTGSRRILKRELETSAVVLNNQTVALGGIIQNRRAGSLTGVPVLQEVPVLGAAFGTRERTIDRTELLILITPRVVAPPPA